MSVVAPKGLTVDEDLQCRVHPFADAFPELKGAAFDQLVEDIKVNGQQEPILCIVDAERNEVIIDGRTRLRACRKLGFEPALEIREPGTEEELLALIWSKNVHRRQLTASQRAALVIKHQKFVDDICATNAKRQQRGLKRGSKKAVSREGKVAPTGNMADTLAKMANCSPRTIKDASAVQKSGDKELIEKMERGEVSASAAAKEAREKRAPTKRSTKKGAAAGPPPGLPEHLPYNDANGQIHRPTRLSSKATPQQAAKELLENHGRVWCTDLVVELEKARAAR